MDIPLPEQDRSTFAATTSVIPTGGLLEAPPLAREPGSLRSAQLPGNAHEKILIVDDEECVRDLVTEVLASDERERYTAASLAQAREIIAHQDIDLVICDIRLPDGNGIDLLEWCNGKSLDIPFILVTGFADTDNVIKALNLGAASLLEKPFDISLLLQTVKRCLAEQRCERIEEEFRAHMQRSNRELRQEVADIVTQHQKLYLGTLKALAKTIDARDPYTHLHSTSVAALAGKTAQAMGLTAELVEVADIAGILHDIGKLAVPEAILLKPGALTHEEFSFIKSHPEKSRDILADLPDMDQVKGAVHAHHERYDGKGYPCGLAGQDIPLLARVIAVCDTWDAMTTDRPYRKAMPEDQALAILREETGKQFDPEVVEAFLKSISSPDPTSKGALQ